MMRTPSQSATAMVIAALALAWGVTRGAHDPDLRSGFTPLPLLR